MVLGYGRHVQRRPNPTYGTTRLFSDTRGGALSRDLASGCLLFVFFEPRAEQIAESISGDRAIMSNDPALRAARPIVRQIIYRYP